MVLRSFECTQMFFRYLVSSHNVSQQTASGTFQEKMYNVLKIRELERERAPRRQRQEKNAAAKRGAYQHSP